MSVPEPLVQRSPTALWRRAVDEVIVALPGRVGIDRLMGPAATAWDLLAEPRAVRDLVDDLAEIYGVRADRIASQVRDVVADLLRRGSLEQVGSD